MRKPFTTPYKYRQRTVSGRKGSRSVSVNNYYNEVDEEEDNTIRKGPWKAEEDEVLINHVNKYGPREWSSIRSKGLLRRTGKSCRLRWVNKLRPDLKNGCKFSVEEERLVIEMQAQIGNKWAKIATYLPGRTDNDVKNFWSSRQKRLARMRQASSSTSSTTPPLDNPPPDNNTINNHIFRNTEDDVLSLQIPDQFNFSDHIIPDSAIGNSTQSRSLFSAYISHEPESMMMVELPALIMNSDLLNCGEAKKDLITTTSTTSTGNPSNEISSVTDHFFHLSDSVLNTDCKTEPEGQVINEELPLIEPDFIMDVFGENGINDQLDRLGGCDSEVFCSVDDRQLIFGDQQQLEHEITKNGDDLKYPDLFFDDFPSDLYFDDQIESLENMGSLPSPSNW